MKRKFSASLDNLDSFANKISRLLKGGEVIGLIGPLGAGKTALVKALAKILQVQRPVASPTFVLLQLLEGRLNKKPLTIYHLDLYRIKNYREVKALGIEDFWQQPQSLTLIEWADKIKKHLPKNCWQITFN